MYRKDFIEKELEKLGLLLGHILGLKKKEKACEEIQEYGEKGLKELFGNELVIDENFVATLSPQKQQMLADILFELAIAAHEAKQKEKTVTLMKQYLLVLEQVEKNSLTFAFQNPGNKQIVREVLEALTR